MGRIQKNKHFFYVNYEGYRHTLGQSQTDFVPDANARNGMLPCPVIATAAQIPGGCGSPDPLNANYNPNFATTLGNLVSYVSAGKTIPGFTQGGFIQGALNLMEPPCTRAIQT